MDAATLQSSVLPSTVLSRTSFSMIDSLGPKVVGPAEFRSLIVSHRRMKRVDRRADKIRGLEDLDTGEVFLTDERRLFEAVR